jgi:NAD(P)-dependent dehydrogenase (short-subunit alcohol dehydrogenase family)
VTRAAGRLANKAGVITGATSGLGLAVLREMAREGASLVAVGRDVTRGAEIERRLRSTGARVVFHQGDVTREEDILAAVQRCVTDFGRLDIMHNNAAYLVTKELHETTNQEWHDSLATNLSSVFWGTKHAVLAMREAGHGGSIINTASTASFTATADTASYVATKTGVLGLTRASALAYAKDGIRCNALCPGDFESPMFTNFLQAAPDPSAARADLAALYPTNRILQPQDIAHVAVFLASDDAHAINGASIVVDDGILAKTY